MVNEAEDDCSGVALSSTTCDDTVNHHQRRARRGI